MITIQESDGLFVFDIRGWEPVARTNPRPIRMGKKLSLAQTPRVRDAKAHIAGLLKENWKRPPLECPVVIKCSFFFVPPKSWPKWKREAALAGDYLHAHKPDASNLLKLLEDAFTDGGAWKDDALVVRAIAKKAYREDPGVEVMVKCLPQAEHAR